DDKFAWDAEDGGQYSTTHLVAPEADGAQSVYAADVDGDGDLDVLSASFEDDKIAWYENLLIINAIEDEEHILSWQRSSVNYPNPFRTSTTIRFNLERTAAVNLAVYDISGKLVKTIIDQILTAGAQAHVWNGRNNNGKEATSGLYLYKLVIDTEFRDMQKMVIIR
ncbi:MAG: T9SS type A sorting domain-containing protein, partial [Planctomycetes bacterium]|nr:T9SS type A sorting domain-containing protein [Planctomycetota bacterium]